MPKQFTPTTETMNRLNVQFQQQNLGEESPETENCAELRASCRELAQKIVERTPPSVEQSTALMKLNEVMFWANAAVARHRS